MIKITINKLETVREFTANITLKDNISKEQLTKENVHVVLSTKDVTILDIKHELFYILNPLSAINKTVLTIDAKNSLGLITLIFGLLLSTFSNFADYFSIDLDLNFTLLFSLLVLSLGVGFFAMFTAKQTHIEFTLALLSVYDESFDEELKSLQENLSNEDYSKIKKGEIKLWIAL